MRTKAYAFRLMNKSEAAALLTGWIDETTRDNPDLTRSAALSQIIVNLISGHIGRDLSSPALTSGSISPDHIQHIEARIEARLKDFIRSLMTNPGSLDTLTAGAVAAQTGADSVDDDFINNILEDLRGNE